MQSEKEFVSIITIGNTTEQNIPYDRTTELDWIIPVLVNITLIFVHFWFLVSLTHYGIKHKMWRVIRNKSDVLNTGLVYGSVIGCAVACVFRLVISLVLMNIGFNNVKNELCDQFVVAVNVSYGFVHIFVALFLWSRQRSFFANKLLNFNYSRPMMLFSSYVIVFLVSFGIFALVYYSLDNLFTSSQEGCVQLENKLQIGRLLFPILAVIFYNVALLGLLFYALTRAKSFQRKETAAKSRKNQQIQDKNISRNSTIEAITSDNINHDLNNVDFEKHPTTTITTVSNRYPHNSTSNKITAILQRTLLFAILSIFVEVLFHLFDEFILDPNSQYRIGLMNFDIAAFFNLIFVVLSFAARKDMMTSPCRKIDFFQHFT